MSFYSLYTEDYITKNADTFNREKWAMASRFIDLTKFSDEFFHKFHRELVWYDGTYLKLHKVDHILANPSISNEFVKKFKKYIPLEINYKKGKIHKKGNPAVIKPDGAEMWYKNGKLHREDGPAVTYAGIAEHYYIDDNLHREDGPAMTYDTPDGSHKEWWVNGKLHRDDGPAQILSNGQERWFDNGMMIKPKDK